MSPRVHVSILVLLAFVLTTSLAFAQTPKITSISKVTAQRYQTITITGTGFGTMNPYSGDSNFLAFNDGTGGWQAGYAPDGNGEGLIVNSWTDTQIVLGGFSGNFGEQYLPHIKDKIWISVWNAQSGAGPSVKKGSVAAVPTTVSLSSTPNPSAQDQDVTFTATVTSSDGPPPDGEVVSFMAGQTELGTGTLSGGIATFDTAALPSGKTTVKAVYAGDAQEFRHSKSNAVRQVVQ